MAMPTSIRFPEALRERIIERAEAERRTFSNTVRVLLEDGLAAREEAVVAELGDAFPGARQIEPPEAT